MPIIEKYLMRYIEIFGFHDTHLLCYKYFFVWAHTGQSLSPQLIVFFPSCF